MSQGTVAGTPLVKPTIFAMQTCLNDGMRRQFEKFPKGI